ncbi:fasciclin domain-containing protein [Geodermatophilus sp. TF02-6]|uniref:fasciclin domain-containing protein n=1 Tax=Geodermatophilus sp. TF02-6 TaxID=2250575 RepID=UPI000DE9B034|nr:fasciclin domain-containing protein [Geodermatophilus sp. TF02-6]RBY81721.1 fasciclin domain-containing protein [Geodermatophilus sp. TF02-6]
MTRRRTTLAVAVALVLPLGACGSAGPSPEAAAALSTSAAPAGPFGAGCSALPLAGTDGRLGAPDTPLVTAAAGIPVLSRFTAAVRAATLVDSLNVTEDVTVLVPADPAFEAVPADTLDPVLADMPRLTALLTHHVIPGRLTPAELAGTHPTLNGDQVTVDGSDEGSTITADQTLVGTTDAAVACGGLRTANATVYVLDQVLAPPSPSSPSQAQRTPRRGAPASVGSAS